MKNNAASKEGSLFAAPKETPFCSEGSDAAETASDACSFRFRFRDAFCFSSKAAASRRDIRSIKWLGLSGHCKWEADNECVKCLTLQEYIVDLLSSCILYGIFDVKEICSDFSSHLLFGF